MPPAVRGFGLRPTCAQIPSALAATAEACRMEGLFSNASCSSASSVNPSAAGNSAYSAAVTSPSPESSPVVSSRYSTGLMASTGNNAGGGSTWLTAGAGGGTSGASVGRPDSRIPSRGPRPVRSRVPVHPKPNNGTSARAIHLIEVAACIGRPRFVEQEGTCRLQSGRSKMPIHGN
jgi:hypothetical protein